MEEIKRVMKHLRDQRGLSYRELGERIGVHYSTLQKAETGENKPSLDLLEKLATFYDVHISVFFGEKDEVPIELKELGVEWISLSKELKDKGLTPDEVNKMVDFAKKIKSMDTNF